MFLGPDELHERIMETIGQFIEDEQVVNDLGMLVDELRREARPWYDRDVPENEETST